MTKHVVAEPTELTEILKRLQDIIRTKAIPSLDEMEDRRRFMLHLNDAMLNLTAALIQTPLSASQYADLHLVRAFLESGCEENAPTITEDNFRGYGRRMFERMLNNLQSAIDGNGPFSDEHDCATCPSKDICPNAEPEGETSPWPTNHGFVH